MHFKNVEETDADTQSLCNQIDEDENEFQCVSEIPDIPTLDEINADIQNMHHKFDENVLQNIANTINLNVDFEINQMVQEENEIPDGNITKRRRKSCLEDNLYLGKKLVDGMWTDVERPGTENGGNCVSNQRAKTEKKTPIVMSLLKMTVENVLKILANWKQRYTKIPLFELMSMLFRR